MEVKRTVLKVQEVVYVVLEFREKKHTFTKVDGGNVDFSLQIMTGCDTKVAHQCLLLHSWPPKKARS